MTAERRVWDGAFRPGSPTGVGDYLLSTHHAVWHSPLGKLFDITPLVEEVRYHPIRQNGDILFLVDDAATPTMINRHFGVALPIKFFALGDHQRLTAYVDNLNRQAEAKYQQDLEEAGRAK